MAVNATYTLSVDLTNDLDYVDANEDISAYWKRIDIQYGMTRPGEHMGRSATMNIVLNNSSHKFSPQHASALSGFTVGHKIKLTMTYSAVTVTLFEGRIDEIAPQPGKQGNYECVVRCIGFMTRLQNGEVGIDVSQNTASGALITSILNNLKEYPAMLTGWFLGKTDWAKLGTTTTLSGGAASFANVDTGANTYTFAGDNFSPGMSPYGAIRLVVDNERGWFFEGRDGKQNFWDRHHLHKDLPNAVDATLTDSGADGFTPTRYNYGGSLVNAVEIDYHPRRVEAIGVVLGQTEKQIRVKANSSASVTIRFVDEGGREYGGTNIIALVPSYDYRAARGSNAQTDFTKWVSCTVKPLGNKAEVTFTNAYRQDVSVLRGVTVRGTRITNFGAQKTGYSDTSSIDSYGRAFKRIDARMIEDSYMADDIALWEVSNHKTPTGNLEEIMFYANKSATLMGYARDFDIGARVALSETETGANNEYFIIGKSISLSPQYIHQEKWILEPKPNMTAWLVGQTGFGNLGNSTYLGA